MDYYDLSIIGAGWSGFNAAIRASQLGLKVALIDRDSLGGTCLNYGCIPTKSLIQSAKIYKLSRNAAKFGIETKGVSLNFNEIQSRKNRIIQQLKTGLEYLIKNSNIDFINAPAKFHSSNELLLGDKKIKSKNILLATGSKPVELKAIRFDKEKVLSSKELLNITQVPSTILIIGGGVIGCEFACLFNILGSKVTVAELMPSLLPAEDKEITKKLELNFKKKGIKVNTNCDATRLDLNDYEKILVCVGRSANTHDLNLKVVSISTEREKIKTDEHLKTSLSGVYAAGDCTGKIMLAHYAAYQGWQVADNIARPQNPKVIDNQVVPNCIFTDPQIASVGLSQEAAKLKNIEVDIGKFDFLRSGAARIKDETEGFIKLTWNKKTQQIMGASMIGPEAVELIGILTLAISNRLKVSQVSSTIFAHPTLSESISELLKDRL
jgi:dihydrolipoamide dehydrogenase